MCCPFSLYIILFSVACALIKRQSIKTAVVSITLVNIYSFHACQELLMIQLYMFDVSYYLIFLATK